MKEENSCQNPELIVKPNHSVLTKSYLHDLIDLLPNKTVITCLIHLEKLLKE